VTVVAASGPRRPSPADSEDTLKQYKCLKRRKKARKAGKVLKGREKAGKVLKGREKAGKGITRREKADKRRYKAVNKVLQRCGKGVIKVQQRQSPCVHPLEPMCTRQQAY
jgi:hypothetical protein